MSSDIKVAGHWSLRVAVYWHTVSRMGSQCLTISKDHGYQVTSFWVSCILNPEFQSKNQCEFLFLVGYLLCTGLWEASHSDLPMAWIRSQNVDKITPRLLKIYLSPGDIYVKSLHGCLRFTSLQVIYLAPGDIYDLPVSRWYICQKNMGTHGF